MEKVIVLFNPFSGKTTEEAVKDKINSLYPETELDFYNVTQIEDLKAFVSEQLGNKILLVGGDGTLNKFVNLTDGLALNNIWYYAFGSGNDFWRDIEATADEPVCIDKYLVGLPTVTVNGKKYKFINGVGFGIDGYCCEVGDKLKAEGKKVDYTGIAIKGLLFHFKPCDATVIVDGVESHYKKVWIAPSMHGRFYGGGMMPTPEQDRLAEDKKVSVCMLSGSGKLHTLIVFPTLFKGKHVGKKVTTIMSGKEITVKFTSPTACQIDGETILNVTEYTVNAAN